jgi:hypothetical protein
MHLRFKDHGRHTNIRGRHTNIRDSRTQDTSLMEMPFVPFLQLNGRRTNILSQGEVWVRVMA